MPAAGRPADRGSPRTARDQDDDIGRGQQAVQFGYAEHLLIRSRPAGHPDRFGLAGAQSRLERGSDGAVPATWPLSVK